MGHRSEKPVDAGRDVTLSDGPYPTEGHRHAEAGWYAAFDKRATHLAG